MAFTEFQQKFLSEAWDEPLTAGESMVEEIMDCWRKENQARFRDS